MEKSATPYWRYLDGLRCLSICWVLLFHVNFSVNLAEHGVAGLIVTRGWMGVDMFFVISGFLITSILLREHQQTGSISLARFYTRRILRLWPAYFTLVSLTLLYAGFLVATHRDPGESAFILDTIKWPALYLTNIYAAYAHKHCTLLHTWSLCLEEQFYLFWSAVLVLAFRRAKWFAVAGIVIVGAWRSWLTFHLVPGPVTFGRTYNAPDTRMDVLLFGCLVAFLLADKERCQKIGAALARPIVPAALVVLFAVAIIICNPWGGHLGTSLGYTVGALTFASSLVYLHTVRPKWAMVLLESRPVVYIGRISYGIYIFQRMIIDGMVIVFGSTGVAHKLEVTIFSYAVTILVATMSFRLIESPFLRLKERFSAIRPAPVPALTRAEA